MILLFEGYPYITSKVEPYIKGFDHLDGIKTSKGKTYINYVGYFLNNQVEDKKTKKTISEIVLILPKVFVYKNDNTSFDEENISNGNIVEFKAFGEYNPEDIINFSFSEFDKVCSSETYYGLVKSKNDYNDIYTLSTWIYQGLRKYRDNVKKSKAFVENMGRVEKSNSMKTTNATLLDLVLSIKKFVEENQDFFTFVYKNSHSGYNKVNWRRTVSKELPIPINGRPFYVDFHTKKKTINFDEELLIILYSTVEDIQRRFGIKIYKQPLFETMSEKEFDSFSRRACAKLREIKYRYFSDKTIDIWQLLFNYFNRVDTINSDKKVNDYLLINKFDRVFEDMIDYLIGDKEYPNELKDQDDNKFVDHIYKDSSLIYDDLIYYVGDSKYYKDADDIERKSIAKQYTYARNIIQRNIEVFYELVSPNQKGIDKNGARIKTKEPDKYFKYRDELTEGYNITPNFFITGIVRRDKEKVGKPLDFSSEKTSIQVIEGSEMRSRQFANRLFDRDTLLMQKYNVNFLYCLECYVNGHSSQRRNFRIKSHQLFKEGLRELLNNTYDFYRLNYSTPNQIKKFVDENFRWIIGKVFSFQINNGEYFLLLALEKGECDANVFVDRYGQICIKHKCIPGNKYTLSKNDGLILN